MTIDDAWWLYALILGQCYRLVDLHNSIVVLCSVAILLWLLNKLKSLKVAKFKDEG